MTRSPIRVLVVDDSALVRKILCDGFAKDPELHVVGQAGDPYRARDLLVELRPDVITLDVEMPRMDGVTFLRRFMPVLPTPTVMVSSLTRQGQQISLDALEAGAVDVVAKPELGVAEGLTAGLDDLRRRVKAAAGIDVSRFLGRGPVPLAPQATLYETTDKVIAIGASTGGVQALSRILPVFAANAPSIVVVQHMPAGVTASFAQRLDGLCAMHVKEAEHGEKLTTGLVLIAPGGERHMKVVRSGGEYRVVLEEGPEVCFSRPSVDVLFEAVAAAAGGNARAALLTGMGRDGAAGLAAIRLAGGRTVVQDEATCVVYGMPKVALAAGAAEAAAPLEQIPEFLTRSDKRIRG